jgi:hypothetical protein
MTFAFSLSSLSFFADDRNVWIAVFMSFSPVASKSGSGTITRSPVSPTEQADSRPF